MEEPDPPDCYEILGIGPQSPVKDIKRAFYRLAKLHHPDKQAQGTCADASQFRKVREAQMALCDENTRQDYDKRYEDTRRRWLQYRNDIKARQAREEFKRAEEERERHREREEAAKREAENERTRKIVEEERLLAEKAARERLRAHREREAEERSREVGRRAREQQDRDAKERLRRDKEQKARQEQEAMEQLQKDKERKAEERSKEVAKKRREQQDREAKERLEQILMEHRHDTLRKNWTTIREEADLRSIQSAEVRRPTFQSGHVATCTHPQVSWPRKNGLSYCYFCARKCAKYSFRCPSCNIAACSPCKQQRCIY